MAFIEPLGVPAAFMGVASKLLSLQDAPLVKGLVHHVKAHPVAEIQQGGIRRIVGHTDGVYSHVFQLLKPSFPDLGRYRRPHASAVMVDAYAVQLFPFPVDQKALIAVKSHASDSGQNADLILLFSLHPHHGLNSVLRRAFAGPQRRPGNIKTPRESELALFRTGNLSACFRLSGCAKRSVRRIHADFHADFSGHSFIRSRDPRLHNQGSFFLRCLLTAGTDPIGRDMDRLHADQPHISCDSGAGIPAGIGLGGIVHLNIHDIFLSIRLQELCHIPLEGCVTIHMPPQLLSVEPDPRQHIRTVEPQDHPSRSDRLRIDAEHFPVPADSRFRISAGAAGRRVLRERIVQAPVMGQLHRAKPLRARFSRNRLFSRPGEFSGNSFLLMEKIPVPVKVFLLSCFLAR